MKFIKTNGCQCYREEIYIYVTILKFCGNFNESIEFLMPQSQ